METEHSTKYARPRIRALQSTGDPAAYRIPPADNDLEIDEPGFSLLGWIGETSGEKELDSHDPLLFQMDSGLPFFPQAVLEALEIRPNITRKGYLDRNVPNNLVAKITSWSDPHEDRDGVEYSAGWQLQLKIDRLLSYLQVQNRCLILEVQIDREERRYGKKENFDYKPPAFLLYLLHPNGHLETMEHHYRLRTEDT